MSRRRARALYRARGFLPLLLLIGFFVMLVLAAGLAAAGDVAASEALGELGVGASQTEAPVSQAPEVLPGASVEIPWVETSLYLLAASFIFAGYALAARKLPWLRLRRPRKS